MSGPRASLNAVFYSFKFDPFFENVTVHHDGVIISFRAITDHHKASHVATLNTR